MFRSFLINKCTMTSDSNNRTCILFWLLHSLWNASGFCNFASKLKRHSQKNCEWFWKSKSNPDEITIFIFFRFSRVKRSAYKTEANWLVTVFEYDSWLTHTIDMNTSQKVVCTLSSHFVTCFWKIQSNRKENMTWRAEESDCLFVQRQFYLFWASSWQVFFLKTEYVF